MGTASKALADADVRHMKHYSPAAAATQLRVSAETVRKLCRAGTVHAYRVGREWRIPETELNRLLREGTTPAYPSTPPPKPSEFGPVAAGIVAAVPDRTAQHRLSELATDPATTREALVAGLVAASVHLTPGQAHSVRGVMVRKDTTR